MIRRYEYKIDGNRSEQHLNELGNQGWDVIGIDKDHDTYLKREALDFRQRVTLEQRARVYRDYGLPLPEDDR